MYQAFGKRLLDIVFSICSLIVLGPLMLVVALVIWREDRGPSLFKQKRVGRFGQEFTVFKFRSMPVNTGDVPSAEAKSLKITKVGGFIRRTSIDELPQLMNILKGDMSLVGFRPALSKQIFLCERREALGVHNAKPGLTGLAQIKGFDGMDEQLKADLDATYVKSISFLNDLSIVLKTFVYVLKPPPTY